MMFNILDASVSIDKGLATLTGRITAVLNQPLAVEHKKTCQYNSFSANHAHGICCITQLQKQNLFPVQQI